MPVKMASEKTGPAQARCSGSLRKWGDHDDTVSVSPALLKVTRVLAARS